MESIKLEPCIKPKDRKLAKSGLFSELTKPLILVSCLLSGFKKV